MKKTKPVTLALLLLCVLVSPAANAQDERGDRRRLDLELRPYVAWAYASHSLTRGFTGAEAGLRVNPFFEIALDGAWYAPFNSGLPGTPTPVNEARWSADLDFVVYPIARLTRPSEQGGTIEPYILGGIGVIADRPVAVVDSSRNFGDQKLVDFVSGIGCRLFVTRWLALSLDVRDAVYFDKRENVRVPNGSPSLPISDPNSPANPATFYDPNTYFTNDLQVRLGVGFVLAH